VNQTFDIFVLVFPLGLSNSLTLAQKLRGDNTM